MFNLTGKCIFVTGGKGFLGSEIVWQLTKRGIMASTVRKAQFNLQILSDCERAMENVKPDVVIHSAALYGGLGINQTMPGRIYYENTVMAANVIEAARRYGVEKFVGVGTACAYPGHIVGSLNEDDLWAGPVHESVRNYGAVKKMMQIQCEAYKKEYGFNGIHVMLANLYGPWDSYSPERSHVVAALIRKFYEADRDGKDVDLWGTGSPIREFLYVRDAAEGIIKALELWDSTEPINIGTGIGTSIRELAETIADVIGFKGRLNWDATKPDGQAKKVFDTTRMKAFLNWEAPTSLKNGLASTLDWFNENYDEAIARW